MTAPDKIWIDPNDNIDASMEWRGAEYMDWSEEYTRSDLTHAMLAEARAEGRAEGLREALDNRPTTYAIYGADRTDRYAKGYCGGVEGYYKTILALIDAEAPAPAQLSAPPKGRVTVPEGQTPLDNKLRHPLLDAFNEGIAARDSGECSPYHGHSLEHCIHAAGWVQRDLRLALDEALAPTQPSVQEAKGATADTENRVWLKAIEVVSKWRNAHAPGAVFKQLNEVMGALDNERRAALRALAEGDSHE